MALLEAVRWVSATADIWSFHKRAFIGVTFHYVDPVTLKIVSSALACRRFKGKHTGIEIDQKLASIPKEFNILSKVLNVVMDNASNFVKASTCIIYECQMIPQIATALMESLTLMIPNLKGT